MTHMIAVPNGVVPCTSFIRTCTYISVQVIVQMTKLCTGCNFSSCVCFVIRGDEVMREKKSRRLDSMKSGTHEILHDKKFFVISNSGPNHFFR